MDLKELRKQLREVKAEMKAKGIKRISMMNGGHSAESMRLNEKCFAIETRIGRAS